MDKLLNKYAKLVVKTGVNLQKGQLLVINSPIECADFARRVAKEGFEAGCSNVKINWSDEKFSRIRFDGAANEIFDEFPQYRYDMFAISAGVFPGPVFRIRTGALRRALPFRMDPDDVIAGSAGNVEDGETILQFRPFFDLVMIQDGVCRPEKTVVPCLEVEIFLFFRYHDYSAKCLLKFKKRVFSNLFLIIYHCSVFSSACKCRHRVSVTRQTFSIHSAGH